MKPDLTTLRDLADLQQRLYDAVIGVKFTGDYDSLEAFWESYGYSVRSVRNHVRFVNLSEVSRDGKDLFLECIRKGKWDTNFAKKTFRGRTYDSFPTYADCGEALSSQLEAMLEDDAPLKIPFSLLSAFVHSTHIHIQTEWTEASHLLHNDYSTHPNANAGYASILKRSCLERYNFHGISGTISVNTDPSKWHDPFFDRVAEYYELLSPSGFGVVRSMMQKKASKKHFNTIMNLLSKMEHNEEFWDVYVPYVKQVMDRTWKVTDREFGKLDGYDPRLCGELVLVWKISTEKLLTSFHTDGLPGNPLAFVFAIPGWRQNYGDSRQVYPSVEVLTVQQIRSDILPQTEQLPNLKKVMSGSLLYNGWNHYMSGGELKTRYPNAEVSEGDAVTKFIKEHFEDRK